MLRVIDWFTVYDIEAFAIFVELDEHGEALKVLHGLLERVVVFEAHDAPLAQLLLNV